MPIHREQRPADMRGVLDEFEEWLLRERSVQEHTAGVYTARVAGFVKGHWFLPGGGRETCPVTVVKPAQ